MGFCWSIACCTSAGTPQLFEFLNHSTSSRSAVASAALLIVLIWVFGVVYSPRLNALAGSYISRLWLLCLICSRSEEHTSELQSRGHLVCRLLLEKKNRK